MAVMMRGLCGVLTGGRAGMDSARPAAEMVADYRRRSAGIRADLAAMEAMLGLSIAGVVALVLRAFV